MDNIFNQSATPKINGCFYRVVDRGDVDVDRICHGSVFDAGYAQSLNELLQVIATGKMLLAGAARQFARLVLASVTHDVVHLAIINRRSSKEPVALPLLSRLMPDSGNTGKLVAANTLIRAVQSLLRGFRVRILMDS
ncbi:hypothetical protein [Nitrosomonas communis]|uniref:hypothetical protein n=1 Tax=Nitrosomonas communis TaxID=44574 RepID=UPI0026ED7323|nr:hypothetical protein [Nitrosomonas communis]MCO6427503.1 hypothetical protein [Nitrosomonas communis]